MDVWSWLLLATFFCSIRVAWTWSEASFLKTCAGANFVPRRKQPNPTLAKAPIFPVGAKICLKNCPLELQNPAFAIKIN
jgi:hypothetical protein